MQRIIKFPNTQKSEKITWNLIYFPAFSLEPNKIYPNQNIKLIYSSQLLEQLYVYELNYDQSG